MIEKHLFLLSAAKIQLILSKTKIIFFVQKRWVVDMQGFKKTMPLVSYKDMVFKFNNP
jgi:hypothetical protein